MYVVLPQMLSEILLTFISSECRMTCLQDKTEAMSRQAKHGEFQRQPPPPLAPRKQQRLGKSVGLVFPDLCLFQENLEIWIFYVKFLEF